MRCARSYFAGQVPLEHRQECLPVGGTRAVVSLTFGRRQRGALQLRSHRAALRRAAFALYEVMLGVLIFAVGIVALGRAVNNCMSASALSTDDARVREILANRMVEIETTPGQPDKTKESKIDTGFGIVKLVQQAAPQQMKEEDGTELTGIIRVTLTANWTRGGAAQSKAIAFYVYRL
jgi:hypothetical protein